MCCCSVYVTAPPTPLEESTANESSSPFPAQSVAYGMCSGCVLGRLLYEHLADSNVSAHAGAGHKVRDHDTHVDGAVCDAEVPKC